MKKILIIALLVFAVGCSKKYTKTQEETARPSEKPVMEEPLEIEEEVIEEVEIPKRWNVQRRGNIKPGDDSRRKGTADISGRSV